MKENTEVNVRTGRVVKSSSEEAQDSFKLGYNCCQSILSAFAPKLGLDRQKSLRMATGFPGGLGYQGETCGAVIGGYLVLGLLAGNTTANDELRKDITYGLIREFLSEFEKRNNSTRCNDLLGIRIETQEGFDAATESGAFDRLCPEFVGDAARILEKLIQKYSEMKSESYFNAIASDWDQMQQSFFSEKIRSEVLSQVNLREGMTVADIGAGSGYMTEGLIDSPVTVIAVDQSEEMLKVLQSKFGDSGKVVCLKGDSDHLPLADHSVEYAFGNMYLHHVEDPSVAILELFRIVKPGGKVIITDLETHEFEFLRTEQFDRWLGFERTDLRHWFEIAGFTDIRISRTGEQCCADSTCSDTTARIHVFLASGTKQL